MTIRRADTQAASRPAGVRTLPEAAVTGGRSTGAPAAVTRTAMSTAPPFPPAATAPALARRHVRGILARWGIGEIGDTAELVASELTANAVAASAPVRAADHVPVIRLCLVTDGESLTIECWDQAPGVPVLRRPAPGLAETGRGLAIIDALTGGAWGCQPAADQAGKCTWARIPVCAVPAGQPGGRRD